jgi:hypothetical protein
MSEPTSTRTPLKLHARVAPALTMRHLMLVLLLAFAASQTLAQQHIHGQEDVGNCVVCVHGDHVPASSTNTATPATDRYTFSWSVGQSHRQATLYIWPNYLTRAPPLF